MTSLNRVRHPPLSVQYDQCDCFVLPRYHALL